MPTPRQSVILRGHLRAFKVVSFTFIQGYEGLYDGGGGVGVLELCIFPYPPQPTYHIASAFSELFHVNI